MKITNEVVLLYQIEEQKEAVIRSILSKMGIKAKTVAPEDFGKPIGSLAGMRILANEEPGEPFSGEMLIMNGLASKRMNDFLAAMRQENAVVLLKAVVTEHNKSWSAYRLQKELAEEHAMMTGQKA